MSEETKFIRCNPENDDIVRRIMKGEGWKYVAVDNSTVQRFLEFERDKSDEKPPENLVREVGTGIVDQLWPHRQYDDLNLHHTLARLLSELEDRRKEDDPNIVSVKITKEWAIDALHAMGIDQPPEQVGMAIEAMSAELVDRRQQGDKAGLVHTTYGMAPRPIIDELKEWREGKRGALRCVCVECGEWAYTTRAGKNYCKAHLPPLDTPNAEPDVTKMRYTTPETETAVAADLAREETVTPGYIAETQRQIVSHTEIEWKPKPFPASARHDALGGRRVGKTEMVHEHDKQLSQKPCPECNGTREVTLLYSRQPCKTCGGKR